MEVAYAFETHAILTNEVNVAERRYRQTLIVARTLELKYQKAQRQLKKLSVELDLIVVAALKKVAPGSERADLKAHCPEILRLRLPECVHLSQESGAAA